MASNVQTTTITIGGEVSKSLKDAFSFANDGIKRLGTEVTLRLEAQLGGVKKLVMGASVQRAMNGEVAALDRAKAVLES